MATKQTTTLYLFEKGDEVTWTDKLPTENLSKIYGPGPFMLDDVKSPSKPYGTHPQQVYIERCAGVPNAVEDGWFNGAWFIPTSKSIQETPIDFDEASARAIAEANKFWGGSE